MGEGRIRTRDDASPRAVGCEACLARGRGQASPSPRSSVLGEFLRRGAERKDLRVWEISLLREMLPEMRRPADGGADVRGFTLIELLVVMAMLAIAAAVAVPALRPPHERSAGAAADSLLHVLARARADAASRGTPVRVEVRPGDGAFAVTADADDGARDTLRSGTLPLPAGGRVLGGRNGDPARVAFDPAGRARADRIAVADAGGRIGITVDAWSGAARAAR
jgi:general secretion pathway protein H